jgi:hypothetical protein
LSQITEQSFQTLLIYLSNAGQYNGFTDEQLQAQSFREAQGEDRKVPPQSLGFSTTT